jgi:hypothetical protein
MKQIQLLFLKIQRKHQKKSNERLLRFISAAFVTHTLGDFQIEGYNIYRDIDKYDINVECEESFIRGQSYIIKTSFFASNELFIVSNDCIKIFIARYNNAVKVHKQFADIFRDIIPFGTPPKLKLNATICQIAHAIYHDNDFDSLPILADALGELNNDQKIIDDCRLQRKRYKGYWLIDHILDKR